VRLLALGAALAGPEARAESGRLILATHDAALASALSVAVSPRGLSVMELEAPYTRAADVVEARREVVARDAVAAVWLCDDDAGARALCFCAHDGRFVAKPVSVASPLAPPDAAALALSVKLLLGPVAPAAAPPPSPPPPAQPKAVPPVIEVAPEQSSTSGRFTLGLSASVLPGGSISIDAPTSWRSDAKVATGLAPFVDYALTPYLSAGFSPRILFNVASSGDRSAATEIDLRGRLSLQLPATSRIALVGRVSSGYSIVALPSSTARAFAGTTAGTPNGWLLGLTAGAAYMISARMFLLVEVGYQLGFQRATFTADAGGETETGYRTRYPHVGLGFGVAL
jgi:hypothetical protein